MQSDRRVVIRCQMYRRLLREASISAAHGFTLLGALLQEGDPLIRVSGSIGNKQPKLRAAWCFDVSPPPHNVPTDRPTRVRFVCVHRGGDSRQTTISISALEKKCNAARVTAQNRGEILV
jgi:hypothetical protein